MVDVAPEFSEIISSIENVGQMTYSPNFWIKMKQLHGADYNTTFIGDASYSR